VAPMLAPILALALQPEIPVPFRGSMLYQQCKGAIRWLDAPDSAKPSADSENFDNCTAYIGGFLEGAAAEGTCGTVDATIGTIAHVYVAFMDKNPKLLDGYRFTGFHFAFREAYPCHSH
jgi:hypothetical protein